MSITSLNKPMIDSTGWGANVNQNFTDIENFAKGTEAAQAIQVDNLNLNGNTISSTDTNGNINITPDGTGKVVLDGLNWPTADGSDGQVLQTDGAGALSFADASGGDLVLISTATASNDATIEFTSGIDSTYRDYLINISDLIPSTDGTYLHISISTDSGSSWKTGSTDYAYVAWAGAYYGLWSGSSNADSKMLPHRNPIGNASGEGFISSIRMASPSSGSTQIMFFWEGTFIDSSYTLYMTFFGSGFYRTAEAINGIRFAMNSGNISSGTFKLYGLK